MLAAGPLAELQQQRAAGQDKADTGKAALRVLEQAMPIGGTPAEQYLRNRGIALPLPDALRFALIPAPKNSGVRNVNGEKPLPALIAIVSDADGTPAGIQRIYLTPDGRKAESTDQKVKYSLGRVKGGAIRLAEAADGMALSGIVASTTTTSRSTANSFGFRFRPPSRSYQRSP